MHEAAKSTANPQVVATQSIAKTNVTSRLSEKSRKVQTKKKGEEDYRMYPLSLLEATITRNSTARPGLAQNLPEAIQIVVWNGTAVKGKGAGGQRRVPTGNPPALNNAVRSTPAQYPHSEAAANAESDKATAESNDSGE